MFCYQCEQTSKGEGCTKIGVCGKTADVAALQDLLIYTLKGLSLVAIAARQAKARSDGGEPLHACRPLSPRSPMWISTRPVSWN